LRGFGLVMAMGPIASVQQDSPGAKAGLRAGDVIEQVDGKPIADGGSPNDGWTPATLPDYLRKAAVEGREVEFTVRRQSAEGSAAEEVVVGVVPSVPTVLPAELPLMAPMAANAVGIAYHVENKVHAVVPSGPAASTGISAGDRIVGAVVQFPKDYEGETPDPITLGPEDPNWPALMEAVQFAPTGTKVEFSVVRDQNAEPRKVSIELAPVEGSFIADRGLLFEPVERIREADTFAQAVSYGLNETVDSLSMVIRFLKKLGTRQVPISGDQLPADPALGRRAHGVSRLRGHTRPAGERKDRPRASHGRVRVHHLPDAVRDRAGYTALFVRQAVKPRENSFSPRLCRKLGRGTAVYYSSPKTPGRAGG
jgi:hypothetical protein